MWFEEVVELCAFLPYLQNERSSFAALKDEGERPLRHGPGCPFRSRDYWQITEHTEPEDPYSPCEERTREDLEKTGR